MGLDLGVPVFDPRRFFGFFFQALPNQGTVDYPSFKLVIVGDGGTGEFPISIRILFRSETACYDMFDASTRCGFY